MVIGKRLLSIGEGLVSIGEGLVSIGEGQVSIILRGERVFRVGCRSTPKAQ